MLLRAQCFASWPLQVRFFCRDAYDLWVCWSDRVNGDIQAGISVSFGLQHAIEAPNQHEEPQNAQMTLISKPHAIVKSGIGDIVGYSKLKEHVEKSLFLLAKEQVNRCSICAQDTGSQDTTILVCSQRNCQAISHMTCLAARFLETEKRVLSVIPRAGMCPHCHSELQWIDMVKEMSLRVRGKSELTRLKKKRKVPKKRAQKDTTPYSEELNDDANERPVHCDESELSSDHDESLPMDWDQQDHDEDEMSADSFVSHDSKFHSMLKVGNEPYSISRLEIGIQESEWDDNEILEYANGNLSSPAKRR